MSTKCIVNKSTMAAIAAAIRAKDGSTGTMIPSQMAERIASIPSGGGGDLSDIAEALGSIDGNDHSHDASAAIARGIRNIVRTNARRSVDIANMVFHPDPGKSAFAVKIEESTGLDFVIGSMDRRNGSTSNCTVDWGDGSSDAVTFDGNTARMVSHTYPRAGVFLIQISDDVYQFSPHFEIINNSNYSGTIGCNPTGSWISQDFDGIPRGVADVRNKLKIVRAVQWGDSITNTSGNYSGCENLCGEIPEWSDNIISTGYTYAGCSGISGRIPEWKPKIRSVGYTYMSCSGLTGRIPEWGEGVTEMLSVYNGCTGLTGRIPQWPQNVVKAQHTYASCGNLTGSIPEWPSRMTTAMYVYMGCYGLTGTIPEWGSDMTVVTGVYQDCKGLSGGIPPWPARCTNADRTYYNCSGLSGGIPDWAGTITSADSTFYCCTALSGGIPAWSNSVTKVTNAYYQCPGLTGSIPKWGAAITNAGNVYFQCIGLTGIWDDAAPDSEVMPSKISNRIGVVTGTTDSLRERFLTSWGGTRAS